MIVYHPTPVGAERRLAQFYAYRSFGGITRLPAMMAQLQVHLEGGTVYRFPDGHVAVCSGPTLVGASTGHVVMEMPAGATLVGVGLLAEGWKALVGIPADLATDRALPTRSVLSSRIVDRLADVGAAATLDEGVERLRTLVLQAIADPQAVDPRIQAVDAWLQRPGRPMIDDLLQDLELSLRHVERLVRRTHGLTPRLLERKYRTLRVAHALAVDPDARSCPEAFYDQSHLIQNFRRFVGTTPSHFHEEERFLARHLLSERWRSGAHHRLALWG